jgi:hypothetical protein
MLVRREKPNSAVSAHAGCNSLVALVIFWPLAEADTAQCEERYEGLGLISVRVADTPTPSRSVGAYLVFLYSFPLVSVDGVG